MKYPILKPTSDNRYILVESYQVENISIPRGYLTNGADVPKIFWMFVPPFKPKYMPAILIHDYFCDKEEYKKADTHFERILLHIEDTFITRTMIRAVKMYHFIRYRKGGVT